MRVHVNLMDISREEKRAKLREAGARARALYLQPSKPIQKVKRCVLHNTILRNCKHSECGGGQNLCIHRIIRRVCKDPACGGGQDRCIHRIPRRYCKNPACGGGRDLCIHRIRRRLCKDPACGGGQDVCVHHIQRRCCKICSNCGHGTIAAWCKQCDGSLLCPRCPVATIVSRRGALCATCKQPAWKGKQKERKVYEQLVQWSSEGAIPTFTSADKTLPGSGTKYRIDFYYDCTKYFVAVECDESEHALKGYPPRCELVRQYRIVNDRGVPAVFIRFNPDAFKIAEETEKLGQARRYELLKETLQDYIREGPGENFMIVVMICYSQPVGKMHGEKLPYVTTQRFPTKLDYESFVGNVYPNDCNATPTSKVDWFLRC